MAKRKNNKRTAATRLPGGRGPAGDHSQNRNRLLASVVGVSVVAIVALLVLGNNSNTAPSQRTPAAAEQPVQILADKGPTTVGDGHGPSLHFPEPSFDFGTISQGDKVSHTFVVQNKGDEPLKLINAKGS